MRILHVLDHSIPLHSGYTFRTAAILREQRALGWENYHLTSAKQGPTAALFDDPRHPYTRALLSAVPRITGGGIPDLDDDPAQFLAPLVAHEGFSEKERLA